MMIHQQPPPKPLLPQHMICHLTQDFPGHGDRPGRRARAAPGPCPVRPFLGHTMRRVEGGFQSERDIRKE